MDRAAALTPGSCFLETATPNRPTARRQAPDPRRLLHCRRDSAACPSRRERWSSIIAPALRLRVRLFAEREIGELDSRHCCGGREGQLEDRGGRMIFGGGRGCLWSAQFNPGCRRNGLPGQLLWS